MVKSIYDLGLSPNTSYLPNPMDIGPMDYGDVTKSLGGYGLGSPTMNSGYGMQAPNTYGGFGGVQLGGGGGAEPSWLNKLIGTKENPGPG